MTELIFAVLIQNYNVLKEKSDNEKSSGNPTNNGGMMCDNDCYNANACVLF